MGSVQTAPTHRVNIVWVIQAITLLDRPHSGLIDAVKTQGHRVLLLDLDQYGQLDLPDLTDCFVIPYGSFQFIRAIRAPIMPGPLGVGSETNFASWHSRIPLELQLNHDAVMTTWGNFQQDRSYWYDLFGTCQLFVRPNSGAKTFTGCVIPEEFHQYECNAMRQTTGVVSETIIALATVKAIRWEIRFVIVNRQVVAHSGYDWQQPNVQPMIDGEHLAVATCVATQVAQLDWQPDACYTCDVAVLQDGSARVIELNSFSCAGFYWCDLSNIVSAVEKWAYEEISQYGMGMVSSKIEPR